MSRVVGYEVLICLPTIGKLAKFETRRRFKTRAEAEKDAAVLPVPFGSYLAIVRGDRAKIDALPNLIAWDDLIDDTSDMVPIGAAPPKYTHEVLVTRDDSSPTSVADPIVASERFRFTDAERARACANFVRVYCTFEAPAPGNIRAQGKEERTSGLVLPQAGHYRPVVREIAE
jgi:hypothetical protein